MRISDWSSDVCSSDLLVGRGAGDVEDLAAQRQHRLGPARARLLGRAAGSIALPQEDLAAVGAAAAAVGKLDRQAPLTGRSPAVLLLLLASPTTLVGASPPAPTPQTGSPRLGQHPDAE